MDNTNDLAALITSHYSLVVAQSQDEERFMEIVRGAAQTADVPVWTWSSAAGLSRDDNPAQYGTVDAKKALLFIGDITDPAVFVFEDVQHTLDDPVVVRMIKELAQAARQGQTLILAVAEMTVPPELQGLAVPWTLTPPDKDELKDIVKRTLDDLSSRGIPVSVDDKVLADLVDAVRGLSSAQAAQAVRETALSQQKLGDDSVDAVRRAKAQFIGTGGVLEMVESDAGTLDDVGGMRHLKDWLKLRGEAFQTGAAAFGLDPPKGVFLTGVPGCGKSLVAKTIARTWSMPLMLLDPARLYGPYVGQSEQRMGEALHTADSMAPVVLWIDEIEKGFSAGGGEGDGGVSERILGTFLRWMEDRAPGVFVVATCNDVTKLPAELLRKGRFDETFFVDLPGEPEREQIFALQLTRRKRDPTKFDLPKLGGAADGFSGAEIEAAVVGALYRAFAAHADVSTDDVLAEIASTSPLSRTRAEDVQALRDWAKGRAVAA